MRLRLPGHLNLSRWVRRLLADGILASVELRKRRSAPWEKASDALPEEPGYEAHIRRGDFLRDTGRCAEAAEAYRTALALVPMRTDIQVQLGNMLKDSGQLAEAEAVYRSVLTERSDDPDIHLQLGHCLKLQVRHSAALQAYLKAATFAGIGQSQRLAGMEVLRLVT